MSWIIHHNSTGTSSFFLEIQTRFQFPFLQLVRRTHSADGFFLLVQPTSKPSLDCFPALFSHLILYIPPPPACKWPFPFPRPPSSQTPLLRSSTWSTCIPRGRLVELTSERVSWPVRRDQTRARTEEIKANFFPLHAPHRSLSPTSRCRSSPSRASDPEDSQSLRAETNSSKVETSPAESRQRSYPLATSSIGPRRRLATIFRTCHPDCRRQRPLPTLSSPSIGNGCQCWHPI